MKSKRPPVETKLLRAAKALRNQQVVDFGAFAAGRKHSEDLQKTVVSKRRLKGLHPDHAAYVCLCATSIRLTSHIT